MSSALRLALRRPPTLITKFVPTKSVSPRIPTLTRNLHTTLLRPQPRKQITGLLSLLPKHPRRTFTTDPAIPYRRPDRSTAIRKLAISGALFGGTLLAISYVFNDTNSADPANPPLPAYEKQYLNETFLYTGAGLGTILLGSKLLHNAGWSYRLMATNPWLVIGGSLAMSLGFMFGVRATPPENTLQKHALWVGFNLTQALVLAPTFFYAPALIARAGLYTAGVMGSIAYVGATAKSDKYLYLGGPLLAGVAVVALSGLAPLVLPLGSRALVATEAVSLYGGLAVFAGFTLYDVQKILYHARMARQGLMRRDTVNESIALELDFINIFVRILAILGRGGSDRKR